MKCCEKCFGDIGLQKRIIPTFSREEGVCSYCKSENVELVLPTYLRDSFELLIEIYEEDESGQTLVKWLKNDWGIFSHPCMDHANASQLLADILDDGEIVRKKFSLSEYCKSDRLDFWGAFKEELMSKNRFFPKYKMDKELWFKLLQHLSVNPIDISEMWYRSRIQRNFYPYTSDKMGAPPKELASQGRANPVGIPYLYLASDVETAVSEIRPHTGEIVNIADFSVPDELHVIDLCNPRNTMSPFYSDDSKEIAYLRGDIEFLEHLGKELTRPVLPHAAAIDYLPTQYLCESIKQCNYDGVLYKSSVGEGVNLAIFEPSCAIAGEVKVYNVSKVSISINQECGIIQETVATTREK